VAQVKVSPSAAGARGGPTDVAGGRPPGWGIWHAPKGRATTGNTAGVHDLGLTVATGLQRLGVRLEVTEAVLNHISGSRGGIAGVYQRYDWATEKRAALDAWAAHIRSVVYGSIAGANVVTLARPA
jgi:hypothetical protein